MQQEKTLTERCKELWRSGRQVWVMVGDETSRYERSIIQAVHEMNSDAIKAEAAGGEPRARTRVVFHDRWNGFYALRPGVVQAKDKTNILALALQMALMSDDQIKETFPQVFKDDMLTLPFNPEENVIIVFTSFEKELAEQPVTLTFLRNVMHFNMCSPDYVQDNDVPGKRGARMLVFISPTQDFPSTIPELKGEVVPLPNAEELESIALSVLEPEWKSEALPKMSDQELEIFINSMHGMTAADAEEAVALAVIRSKGEDYKFEDLLETIEGEKVKSLGKIPGVTAVPKKDILDKPLPGFEALTEWVNHRMSLSEEQLRKHKLSRMKGVGLFGLPGCGKTQFGKYLARLVGRGLIIWNVGESKGSKVGETEANTRRVLQAARAGRYLVLADDIDKGGFTAVGSGYSGDGGTGENQINMVLQAMADPLDPIMWVLTANRVQNLPAELLRKGRMDELFKLEKPNGPTRLSMLKFHIDNFNHSVNSDFEPDLVELAEKHTQDWLPVELMSLVKDEVTASVAEGTSSLDVPRMCEKARSYTPMIKQRVFAEDVKSMEEASSQFVPLGNLPDSRKKTLKDATEGPGRSRRRIHA
jgi:SpoVK/Ycf46/Vps4 family AAA+-type ATPase